MQGSKSLLLLLLAAVAIQGFHIGKRPHTEGCTCVPYFQCYSNGTMNTGGAHIIEYRSTNTCPELNYICCRDTSGGKPDPTTEEPLQPPKQKDGCGYRNFEGLSSFITSKNQAKFGEFPWTVMVLEAVTNPKPNKVYIGGGSLIHPRVVLTAAHIVRGITARKLHIRAGEWDAFESTEPLPHQDRQVATLIKNPNYFEETGFNDYALLILDKPVDIQPHINTICLPEPEDKFDSSRCISTGWGKDKSDEEGGKYQAILKSVDLPMIPKGRCESMLRKTDLGPRFKLDSSFVCAGGVKDDDACMGDGGGPLVCPLKSDPLRYVQAGIVSWGIKCGKDGNPGVYANVAKVREWIDKSLEKYKMNTNSYIP